MEVIEVGCGRPGAVWLLHFGAAYVIPTRCHAPLDEPGLEMAALQTFGDSVLTRRCQGQRRFRHALDAITARDLMYCRLTYHLLAHGRDNLSLMLQLDNCIACTGGNLDSEAGKHVAEATMLQTQSIEMN